MEQKKFTFFWGGIFSNFHKKNFVVDGKTFNCNEQWMMTCKAKLFKDNESEEKIRRLSEPKEQKKAGRNVKNFNKIKWDELAKEAVYVGAFHKFSQNKELREALNKSEGELVEASPFDKIWGIGLDAKDPLSQNKATWRGTNWLGEVLTELRDDLKKGVAQEKANQRL